MQTQPNVLVLMTDQLRFDALGCAGNETIRTPNLDRLAASGVHFSQACCSTPVCVASRMSFITGLRASDHHWVTNNALPGPVPELPTIMTQLHRAGYHTQGVGKMHFRGRHYGFQGLQRMEECVEFRVDDDYLMYLKEQGVRTRYPHGLRDILYYQPQTSGLPVEQSMSAWVTRQSVQLLRDHARHRPGKPFFLWSSWIAPHPPFAPSEPYDSMYNPEDMDPPVFPERPAATLPCWRTRGRLDGAHLDTPRIQRIRALYYGLVSQVDDGVGEILDALEALGLAGNTAILFVSDHGDMLGDHGLSQKNVPYEASVRIPMILRWPGRTEAGRRSDDLVGLDDFLPTLMEELGLERDPEAPPLPGASLLGRAGGGLAGPRDAYFVDYGAGPGRWISMRTPSHKYALWAHGGFEELYDLEADPHETCNLVDRDPERAVAMRERVLEWEREHGLSGSFENGTFRTYPFPKPETDVPRGVVVNEGRWPENLPENEQDSVESYAEAFTRAIAKETTLTPDKLSLAEYKKKGGHPLAATPWEEAWREA
ncbi:MAG: sulfatase-like hydrolase/transferase [Candidatus Brocadiia bacterium]